MHASGPVCPGAALRGLLEGILAEAVQVQDLKCGSELAAAVTAAAKWQASEQQDAAQTSAAGRWVRQWPVSMLLPC